MNYTDSQCVPQQPDRWTEPTPGHKIKGPFYFILSMQKVEFDESVHESSWHARSLSRNIDLRILVPVANTYRMFGQMQCTM